MKLAYRIITPIFAIGAVVMGLILKLFYFALGGASDEITTIVTLAQQLGAQTTFEYSAVEIIKLLMGTDLSGAAESGFMTIAEPIIPHLIAFVVFFVIALLVFLAVGVLAAIKDNRKTVMLTSVAGLVICFICIIISKLAFDKIIGGEINLTDVDLFKSPAYYLQQNDIVYVQPNDIKARQSTTDDKTLRIASIGLSSGSLLVSVVTLLATLGVFSAK